MTSDQPGSEVRLAMSPDTLPLAHVRARIHASLAAAPSRIVADIELAATELVTNAYKHGRPPMALRLYTLPDGWLRLEVHDSGPALPRVQHPDRTAAGGRGLLLVQAVSARWGVSRSGSGKTVWAEFSADGR